MLAFHTAPKVNIIDITKTCPCCKDILEETNELYVKLSCGHDYHYDCIYDAFDFNKKRSGIVLECPYCRKPVKPLPEKDGFDYCSTIHGGLPYVPGQNDWSPKHKGNGCCIYQSQTNKLYCNVKTQYVSEKYCYKHINTEHKGSGWCIYKKKELYCNQYCSPGSSHCWKHTIYNDAKECEYVFATGLKKGTKCGNYGWLTNETGTIQSTPSVENHPVYLCKSHIKHKDKIVLAKTISDDTKSTIQAENCTAIIRSGKDKGKVCGAINCKRHKAKPIINEPIENDTKKIITIDNIVEPDILVHVEKKPEKQTADLVVNSDNFNKELTELLGNIYGLVPIEYQKQIGEFLDKYKL